MSSTDKSKATRGVVIFFASLWGTSYLLDIFSWESWASFPTLITGIIFGVVGISMFTSTILDEPKEGR